MTVQATFAATLVDEWHRCGLRDAVIAPGSRSTPLTVALADAADAGRLRLHVRLDERSAAFFALGLGLAGGPPAVVVTTSGTAALEVGPAVVEAHHARVGLIVCTADRPPELRDVGAPQTVAQRGLYGDGVLRWRVDPGPPDGLPRGAWRSLAARAVAEARDGRNGPGPVQVNLAFREPLVADAGAPPDPRPAGRPWHEVHVASAAADPGLLAQWSGRPGLIVAGTGCGDPAAVLALADGLGWPVLADPRSGCRGRGHTAVVAAFDGLLRHAGFADAHRPEVVVRLGAPPASKVLAGWLSSSAAHQLMIDRWGAWPDPERTAAVVVAADPAATCRAAAAAIADRSGPRPPLAWLGDWARAESQAQQAVDAVLAAHPEPTEPGVARDLTAAALSTLIVASSMPVRDVEWFGSPSCPARVLANRGANGIDGTVSTALGAAAVSAGPAAALIGDLAFLHDSGGLLGAGRSGIQLALVVVDNDGGGIFSFLPQAAALDRSRFERLFATPHGLDLAALAAAYGLGVRCPDRSSAVGPAVQEAVGAGGVQVVVVRTDRAANVAVHDEINAAIGVALDGR